MTDPTTLSEYSRKKFATATIVQYRKPWQTGFAQAAKIFVLLLILTSAAIKISMADGVAPDGRSTFGAKTRAAHPSSSPHVKVEKPRLLILLRSPEMTIGFEEKSKHARTRVLCGCLFNILLIRGAHSLAFSPSFSLFSLSRSLSLVLSLSSSLSPSRSHGLSLYLSISLYISLYTFFLVPLYRFSLSRLSINISLVSLSLLLSLSLPCRLSLSLAVGVVIAF